MSEDELRSSGMRWSLAVMVVIVTLAALFYGCGRTSSPVEKQDEREGAGQAEPTSSEQSAPTRSSAPSAAPSAAGTSSRKKVSESLSEPVRWYPTREARWARIETAAV